MNLPDPDSLPRRDYLRALVAVGGAVGLSACLDVVSDDESEQETGDPERRPERQHAWNDVLSTDDQGNIKPPEHHVLVALDLAGTPEAGDGQQVEAALHSLERAYPYDHDGLLFTLGYSPSYFEAVEAESPIPAPEALTSFESPETDTFDALLQLSSDRPEVVLEAEEALFGEVNDPNGSAMDDTFDGVFERREPLRRTGFVGEGLPAQFADEVGGVPDEMPDNAPFFMGTRAGFANSQAPEERVTIQSGPFEGGTTTHVESLDIQLETWFEQDDKWLRVAQMFSPDIADEGIGEIGEELGASTGIEQYIEKTESDARERGVVGHAQKAARARDEDGTPPLLRRDFNTTDNGVPGLHFLSHQRSIDDFVRVRQAMAGEDLDGGVGQRHNNGLLQYVFVNRRGNFIVPPRSKRALPELN